MLSKELVYVEVIWTLFFIVDTIISGRVQHYARAFGNGVCCLRAIIICQLKNNMLGKSGFCLVLEHILLQP